MVTEREIEHISELADIGLNKEELGAFTDQFNVILEYFDILDQVPACPVASPEIHTILREDEFTPSLAVPEVLSNAAENEDGFFKAPRVM
jgi:aspartyl-tRNA(Asn)/glutamyl-tRNA(Gln) amidotransferase subunit C